MTSSNLIWVLIAVSFATYFKVSWVYQKLGIGNLQQGLLIRNGLRLLNLKHSIGIALFGILFYAVLPELRYLVNTIEIPRLYILIPFFALLFLVVFISHISVSKTPFDLISRVNYTGLNVWAYFLVRVVFLFSYEFFFRGVILFMLLKDFTLTTAIVLATIPYLVIHFFDSKKEKIGTIPFGIILCVITYLTKSIWYAFVMHLVLSAVYEMNLFSYQISKTLKS